MNYFKFMWVSNEEGLIWDMKTETQINESFYLYRILLDTINIKDWKRDYSNFYSKWLECDDNTIYKIDSDINQLALKAVRFVNENCNSDDQFYYWFDVDRDVCLDYYWTNSPIDNSELIKLDESYPSINRNLDLNSFLVMPD